MRRNNFTKLIAVAMLIALAFVLERFVPAINLPTARVSFSFVPMMFCGMYFGPIWAAAAYGISDFLGWPFMGLAPIPLVLVSRIANGFIFGLVLHRENVKFWPHAVVCSFATQIICGAGLTTLGLSQFFGAPFLPLLWSRVPQLVTYIVLLLAVFPILAKLKASLRKTGYGAI